MNEKWGVKMNENEDREMNKNEYKYRKLIKIIRERNINRKQGLKRVEIKPQNMTKNYTRGAVILPS